MPGTVVVEDPVDNSIWWEADKIVGSRLRKETKEYRVRWVGCPSTQDTWEPEENLADSLFELAQKYDASIANKKRKHASGSKGAKKKKVCNDGMSKDRASWTLSEGSTTGTSLLSLGHLSITSLCNTSPTSFSFASYYFGNRLVTVEIPLKRSTVVPPKVASFGGYSLHLLSSRVPKESAAKNHFRNQKAIRLTYVATEGNEIHQISLKQQLESIADFASLTPEKAKARLQLLESATAVGTLVSDMALEDFKLVEEETHLGCGFIPVSILGRILGQQDDELYQCIQVRVIAPKLGIFKGILCPKPDIDRIELPRSMLKVGPSRVCPSEDWVCLVVKNTFPTSKNVQLGRSLTLQNSTPPSLSHFRNKDQGPGEMVERLWRSLGVKRSISARYAKRCNQKGTLAGLKHAYLLGVADPTGFLPRGHVFVPGMGKEHGKRGRIFLTRSPCIEPSDGRMVPICNTKPRRMPNVMWEWLTRFPFGIVFFGGPRVHSEPLPVLLGGDLDGDAYLVCWDDEILDNVKPVAAIPVRVECELVKGSRDSKRQSGDWLADAQEAMLDIDKTFNINSLNGRLWGAATRAADSSSQFMSDTKAIQLARAYKLSLDLDKHGGYLSVPDHIRNIIPKTLHSAFSPPNSRSSSS